MVRFMPDPLSHEEFNTLKRIGILEVKMKETNQSERVANPSVGGRSARMAFFGSGGLPLNDLV